jgi:hypothetical protein
MAKEKRNRAVPKTVNLKDAAFAYISVCCNAVAEKPACAVPKGHIVGTYVGAVPKDAEGTLGSWRCSSCRKPCKCTRTSQKPDLKVFGKEETANA